VRNLFIIVSEPEIRKQLNEMARVSQTVNDILKKLEAQTSSEGGRALLSKVDDARGAYVASRTDMLEQFKQGLLNEAGMILLRDVQIRQKVYLESLDEFMRYEESQMQESTRQVDASVKATNIMTGLLLVIAVAVAMLLGIGIIRSITQPLRKAVDLSRAVADGNLTVQVTGGGRNELGELLVAQRDMLTRLRQMVQRVREGSESVASASTQISSGSADLSVRTESQASTIEETAATMEELGATVDQNAGRARQANQLAQSASLVAVRGGEVVTQVVATMGEINGSSRKIADIINVIDGIAFQTNILALNAAVEAARAGDQGRGFAVVAAEVRSLAGRSAAAAKEIKSLISASVERVEAGTVLVDQAGATMTEIVASIRQVTDIMGEISAASTEQSLGVAQMGEAITQMDQTIQQNAAMVEEMTAAATNLKRLADDQVQAVAVFKLDQGPALNFSATASVPLHFPVRSISRSARRLT
jgi:methyl-accepting chemotaxis protein